MAQQMMLPLNPPARVGADRRSRARFEEVVDRVLRHEDDRYDPNSPTGGGRLVNHPADPGGHTRLGITLATLRDVRREPNLGPEALESLTLAEIKDIYYARYWVPVRADELPVGLDYVVFDCAVNSGPRRAALLLQQALGGDVRADGVIGPQTVAAARAAASVPELIREYSVRRLAFLSRLPHAGVFGRGWFRRVHEVERDALADVARGPVPLTVAEAVRTDTVKAGGVVAGAIAAALSLVEQVRPLVAALEGVPLWAAAVVVAVVAVAMVIQWRRVRE